MTSQVAVFNMNGIAVASDTVVTSSSKAGSKTTSNSEKIYELGANHKILVMHYGGTTLNDVNHQFQFAEWALTLQNPLKSVEDYMDAYIKWSSVGRKFHSQQSETNLLMSVILEHFEWVKKQIDSEFENLEFEEDSSEDERNTQIAKLNKQKVQDGLDFLKSLDLYHGLTEVTASEAIKAAKIDLGKLVDETFDGYVMTSAIKTALKNSAIATVAREQEMEWQSYLAFVGYGADDPFPSTQVLACRGYYGGQLVFSKGSKNDIQPGSTNAEITRFAQGEAIEAFLKGYNRDILNGITWSIEREIIGFFPEQSNIANQISEKVVEYIEGHSWRNYVRPLLQQVAGMNLFALAELARTMVSIQATFSESQDGPVSVGGLIEVATIDRVNGVQWKQRLPR